MKYIFFVLFHSSIWAGFSSEAQQVKGNFKYSDNPTTIRSIELADSFSKVKDSINASLCLQKVDPYFLISCNTTPETIDAYLDGFLLAEHAKNGYKAKFLEAFYRVRSVSYSAFKAMCEEDQTVRKSLAKCNDSLSRSIYSAKMGKTDSLHFDYLYTYVKKHGWPTYENGCMYAEIIAMHDGVHMKEYLTYVMQAVETGYSSERYYYSLLNRAKPSTLEALSGYKDKTTFDVSYVLKGKRASVVQIHELQKAVVECGAIKHVYFVYESNDKKEFEDFMKASDGAVRNYWLAWDILVQLEQAKKDRMHQTAKNISYDFLFSKSTSKQKKLMLFIVY